MLVSLKKEVRRRRIYCSCTVKKLNYNSKTKFGSAAFIRKLYKIISHYHGLHRPEVELDKKHDLLNNCQFFSLKKTIAWELIVSWLILSMVDALRTKAE